MGFSSIVVAQGRAATVGYAAGKDTVTHGWRDRATAEAIVADSRRRYQPG